MNHLGGYTQVDSQLDFMGKTLATETRHKRLSGDVELLTKEEFTYSAQDRLLTHTHQINGGVKQLLAKNTYDELGQLIAKNVGGTDVTGTNALQKVDYKYNIRGWLKDINDVMNLGTDLFAFKISYNDPATTSKALFNGNISETYWKTSGDLNRRKYEYQYDHLNRLLNAVYKLPDSNIHQKESYQETIAYDKNGNITNLKRWGAKVSTSVPQMDDLIYTYDTSIKNGNRLLRVTDSKSTAGFKNGSNTDDDYAYDANGNMTIDKNKGITAISYNQLNLPVKIEFGTNKIEYLYNATGQKVQKKVTISGTSTTTDYLGGYQYKNNVLEYFPHAEGYVKRETSGTYNYVFNYTDHLGNVRISYSDTNKNGIVDKSNNEILEESNYYPFGLKHEGYNTNNYQANYKYKYNGKELQDELGLNMYDYGARNYDPALGRWMNIDPKCELGRRWSPFTYAVNNPVYFIDPDGMWIDVDDGEKRYRYLNGQYYSQNQKTGKWDVKATVGVDTYAGKILSALNEISGGDDNSAGATFLSNFNNDKINVTIVENAFTDVNSKNKNMTSSDGKFINTSFKQSVRTQTTDNVQNTPFFITLFHEIGHSFANQVYNKNLLDEPWVVADSNNNLPKDLSNSEIYASMIENILRQEKGLPLRTHYAIDGLLGIEDSRILDSTPKIVPNGKQYSMTPTTKQLLNKILTTKR